MVHPDPLRLLCGEGVLHSREQHSGLTVHNLNERLKHIHRQMLREIKKKRDQLKLRYNKKKLFIASHWTYTCLQLLAWY